MRYPRRTKKKYNDLYDDSTKLFRGASVTLYPNGSDEIWIQDLTHHKGFSITGGMGPAGFGIHVSRHYGPGMCISGNEFPNYEVWPEKPRTMPSLSELSIIQYHDDDWSQAFKTWVEGRGEYPGDKP